MLITGGAARLPDGASIGTRRPCKFALSLDDGYLDDVGDKFDIVGEIGPKQPCVREWIELSV